MQVATEGVRDGGVAIPNLTAFQCRALEFMIYYPVLSCSALVMVRPAAALSVYGSGRDELQQ